jgi:type II secretory pathway predicted ATPase ExeA/septal ring-binding cell division protein DamX
MYYSHFGLNQPPFKITPNTDFFFSGGNRGPVLEALIYAISQGEGIIKVTGEVGSGKTMLCHMLQARLPDHIENVYIANPSVSPEEILQAIAFELQLGVPRDASRLEVMQALHDYLLKRHGEGKRVVVFVEESQSMPLPTLEEIRLLSNLETKNDKLLQIVLFGQPELDETLRQNNIRQLRERITHSFRLSPLSLDETREYVMFRMRAAGYHGPELFSDPVIKAVSRAAQGLTRRVNLIADKALLAAFSENTHTIRRKHVDAAVRDSEFGSLPGADAGVRPFWGIALLVMGAAVGVGIYIALQEYATTTTAPVATEAKGRIARLEEPPVQPRVEAATPISQAASAKPDTLAPSVRAEVGGAPSENKSAVTPPRAVDTAGSSTASAPAVAKPESKPGSAPKPKPEPAVEAKPTPKPEPPTAPIPPTHVASAQQNPAASVKSEPGTKVLDPTDILDARIIATEQWLAREDPGTFSIQLLGTNDATLLRFHLNELGKLIEINKVFVYRTSANEKPFLTVLFGSFNSYRAAQEALDKLPESLKVNRPFLRTVGGIREEIARLAKS